MSSKTMVIGILALYSTAIFHCLRLVSIGYEHVVYKHVSMTSPVNPQFHVANSFLLQLCVLKLNKKEKEEEKEFCQS